MSLLFHTLFRLAIAFLTRSKCLLISWPQSLSAVILEHKKIVCHCFHIFPLLFGMTHWKRPWCWKDWGQEKKGATEDETVGWHHRLDEHEFEQTLGDRGGQGSLVFCSPWGHKESHTTERLNNNNKSLIQIIISLKRLSEKAMATHSSTLAWKIPRAEEPGRLQSMGSWRVGHDWATSLSLFTFMHWRRKWQPTPVFLPGASQGRGSLVGCRLWSCTESDTTEAT